MKTLLTDIEENQCIHLNHRESDKNAIGNTCVVGIGNPLHVSDSIGLLVVSKLKERIGNRVCCLNLELYCQLLGDILESHKTIVIVDAVANLDSSDSVLFEIDKAVLNKSQKVISASHGVSWMEELKLANTEAINLFFYGIAGSYRPLTDGDCLDSHVDKLEKVVHLLSRHQSVKYMTEKF